MDFTACTRVLIHLATLEMPCGAVEMAETMRQPQYIVIADGSGEILVRFG